MTEHDLKVNEYYWNAIASGAENFEVRRDDRGFQTGDILHLRPWSDNLGGRFVFPYDGIRKRVTWILTGGQFGIEAGYIVMGLTDA